MLVAEKVIKGAEPFYYQGGSIGILLCHGFIGTPQSVQYIGRSLNHAGYTVSGLRLDGHGTTPQELAEQTYEQWMQNIEAAYCQLKDTCQKVFIVGQSMGGTLTLHTASMFDDVDGIVLINPAIDIPDMQHYRLEDKQSYIQESAPDIKFVQEEEITYTEAPVNGYVQLLDLMDVVRGKLSQVTCPVLGLQSTVDHVVPIENTDYILKHVRSPIKEKRILANSYHVASLDKDRDLIGLYIKGFIEKLS